MARGTADAPLASLLQTTLCGRNFMDVSKICHIINGVPKQMEYRNGEMLYNWLASPIPMKWIFIAGIVYKQMYVIFSYHRDSPAAILIYTMVFTRFFLCTIANDLGT